MGLFTSTSSASELLRLGLGTTDPGAFIYSWGVPTSGSSGLIANVFIANLPQAVLSAIYFTYNGLFTCFMLGKEWNQYSFQRKGLRVSSQPRGAQRSTYFLQLPYKFALLLMVTSGVLHWLCSQSLFFVNIVIHPVPGVSTAIVEKTKSYFDSRYSNYMTCGYSPRAIISVICIGLVMVIAAIFTGRLKFRTAMPIAGSCSASMSAMCQLGEQSENEVFLPVNWGVTEALEIEPGTGIGHCSFTSREVEGPEGGKLYAGVQLRQTKGLAT
jgi:hypothetical protein